MNKKTSKKISKIVLMHFKHQLDCDGQSRLFSWLLQQEGIEHTVNVGMVAWNGDIFPIHYWITFPGSDYVLDCKLRKWFGNHPNIPTGLFEYHPSPDALLQYVKMEEDTLVMDEQLYHMLSSV